MGGNLTPNNQYRSRRLAVVGSVEDPPSFGGLKARRRRGEFDILPLTNHQLTNSLINFPLDFYGLFRYSLPSIRNTLYDIRNTLYDIRNTLYDIRNTRY